MAGERLYTVTPAEPESNLLYTVTPASEPESTGPFASFAETLLVTPAPEPESTGPFASLSFLGLPLSFPAKAGNRMWSHRTFLSSKLKITVLNTCDSLPPQGMTGGGGESQYFIRQKAILISYKLIPTDNYF